VIKVLGRDQLEHRVAQVLQPLVVRRPALRMLVVVGTVGQRLAQKGRLVKANSKRPLELL
jgi:mRNA-degrading endonuclease toxin of MazEF toxin-antitoxin module